jgi:hypothetical protein
VTKIEQFTFSDCPNLASIIVESGNNKYDSRNNCNAIIETATNTLIQGCSSTVIPNSVSSIGNYALIDLHHVTSFTLPNSLQYIGDNAFEGWTSLNQLNAEGITEVPALGNNVWEGVDQSQAYLTVEKDMTDAFLAADQWKEFNINEASAVEGIVADKLTNRVFATFEGYNLIVKADSEIKEVSIYDSSARQFAIETAHSNEVVINTSNWDCPFYIVKVILVDGSMATLKVARGN